MKNIQFNKINEQEFIKYVLSDKLVALNNSIKLKNEFDGFYVAVLTRMIQENYSMVGSYNEGSLTGFYHSMRSILETLSSLVFMLENQDEKNNRLELWRLYADYKMSDFHRIHNKSAFLRNKNQKIYDKCLDRYTALNVNQGYINQWHIGTSIHTILNDIAPNFIAKQLDKAEYVHDGTDYFKGLYSYYSVAVHNSCLDLNWHRYLDMNKYKLKKESMGSLLENLDTINLIFFITYTTIKNARHNLKK